MRRFWLTATMAVAMMATITLAQAEKQDSAHTLVTPNAPDPGRAGTVVQLPQGGTGVTTGGISHYQTLATPGRSATMAPNGGGTSAVVGAGGRTSTVNTPR
ncbi:MAG TPA: hypothetical protein VGO77_10065 [Mycobacterium sp.]|jgi:hypothetical protein|nr:hypothetical protein [Mycobacterium sp.]